MSKRDQSAESEEDVLIAYLSGVHDLHGKLAGLAHQHQDLLVAATRLAKALRAMAAATRQ